MSSREETGSPPGVAEVWGSPEEAHPATDTARAAASSRLRILFSRFIVLSLFSMDLYHRRCGRYKKARRAVKRTVPVKPHPDDCRPGPCVERDRSCKCKTFKSLLLTISQVDARAGAEKGNQLIKSEPFGSINKATKVANPHPRYGPRLFDGFSAFDPAVRVALIARGPDDGQTCIRQDGKIRVLFLHMRRNLSRI